MIAGVVATILFMRPPLRPAGNAWTLHETTALLSRVTDSLSAVLADTIEVRSSVIGDGFLGGALWDVGVTGSCYILTCELLRDSLQWRYQHEGDTLEARYSRGSLRELVARPRGARGFYRILFDAGEAVSWEYVRQEEWTRFRSVSCTISTTVWDALWSCLPGDLSPSGAILTGRDSTRAWAYVSELQHEITDRLLAYDIDFYYDVHTGDRLYILLEEARYPETSETGFRRVLAVKYETVSGGLIEVFPFYHGEEGSDLSVLDHYHRDGASIRTMFLRMPVPFGRISSTFSASRMHPVLGYSRAHNGIDYAAPAGTEIYAVGDGVITMRQYNGGYGNYVRIRHGNGYETGYGHMSGYAQGQSVGSWVRQGQIIGYVGSTGLSTGPHVHFEMRRNGEFVNPATEIVPPVDPLEGAELEEFLDRLAILEPAWERLAGEPLPVPE